MLLHNPTQAETAKTPTSAPVKTWTGSLKKDFDDPQKWVLLIQDMKDKHFHYGVILASERMLQYFSDVKSKEFAYQNIIEGIDSGYPFSLTADFISGDIELSAADNFSQSYNLYKATASTQKNMSKWAENYFGRIDKANFPKYLFYKSLEALNAKKIDEALNYLDDTLARTKGPEYAALAAKAARTLARLLYSQGQYKQSLEVYQNYLLKLNPIEPLDWLETAWNLYRLNRNEEALGILYNLESINDGEIDLEKYIIRSLIYRDQCDSEATEKLSRGFDQIFGTTLEAIKTGKPLKNFPLLKRIYLGHSEYYRPMRILKEIDFEKKRIGDLKRVSRPFADFLYSTEIINLNRIADASEEEALDGAARSLVILSESLRFVKFEVAREKFNPDKVFAPNEPPPPEIQIITQTQASTFDIHWIQWNDFWRDERLLYRVKLKRKCE